VLQIGDQLADLARHTLDHATRRARLPASNPVRMAGMIGQAGENHETHETHERDHGRTRVDADRDDAKRLECGGKRSATPLSWGAERRGYGPSGLNREIGEPHEKNDGGTGRPSPASGARLSEAAADGSCAAAGADSQPAALATTIQPSATLPGSAYPCSSRNPPAKPVLATEAESPAKRRRRAPRPLHTRAGPPRGVNTHLRRNTFFRCQSSRSASGRKRSGSRMPAPS